MAAYSLQGKTVLITGAARGFGAAIAAAAEAASQAVDPPDDIHAPTAYRRALVGTLLERALQRAAAQ
jgi:CO/xanthine dehydrogenase FAD-binding subunit